MNKVLKTAAKCAAGAGIAYLAVGAAIYECVLDVPVLLKIKGSGKLDKQSEQDFWSGCDIRKQAN